MFLGVFSDVSKFGMTADVSTFVELLNVCGACGDAQAALHVEQQMQLVGVEMNLAAVKALASATLSKQHWHRSYDLVQKHFGQMPPETIHSVIYHAIRAKKFEEANEVAKRAASTFPKFVLAEALSKELNEHQQKKD